jgi:uncharacterized membrane protein
VGSYLDAANAEHGFLSSGGTFTAFNLPGATSTAAAGINDTGEIAGYYSDAARNNHGFIYAGSAFSTVDVADARSTLLTRIKNGDRSPASAPTRSMEYTASSAGEPSLTDQPTAASPASCPARSPRH